jgi:CheY-like chemotaxis protein
MTKEVMDRAFDPFFSTKDVGRGTGLGLSQVYGFIKQSKGHVKIYTEPDEGTTVKIYLPRLLQDIDQKNEREQLAEAVEGPGHETILLVEDDGDVRAYFVEVLRDLNYRVLSAHDAVSALGLIDHEGIRIDLLLTDVVLPGMNGRQLAEKAQDRRPSLKVLFTTGYTRNAIVHQGRLDAGVAMIQKPITQGGLASRIRDLLDTPPS